MTNELGVHMDFQIKFAQGTTGAAQQVLEFRNRAGMVENASLDFFRAINKLLKV